MYITDIHKNYCSCPAWKYQKKAMSLRTCKHLKKLIQTVEVTDCPDVEFQTTHRPDIMLYSKRIDKIKQGWVYSVKLDGVRCRWDGNQMISRGGVIVDVPNRIRIGLPDDMLIDGEIWGNGCTLSYITNTIMLCKTSADWEPLNFHVFDVNIKDVGYFIRMNILRDTAPTLTYCKQRVVHQLGRIQTILDKVVASGGEGLVVRSQTGLYKTGRSQEVIKVKPVFFRKR
jgi:DNA ligase 1